MVQTQEQERAKSAWNAIAGIENKVKSQPAVAEKYRSYVKSAPQLILSNGLGQTIAFFASKSTKDTVEAKAYAALVSHLSLWITQRIPKTNNDLLSAIRSDDYDTTTYRQATKEALAFLVWLKRFADAEDIGG